MVALAQEWPYCFSVHSNAELALCLQKRTVFADIGILFRTAWCSRAQTVRAISGLTHSGSQFVPTFSSFLECAQYFPFEFLCLSLATESGKLKPGLSLVVFALSFVRSLAHRLAAATTTAGKLVQCELCVVVLVWQRKSVVVPMACATVAASTACLTD